eukprot:scaffold31067_cov138-Isochrysis_galbana.AAC.2
MNCSACPEQKFLKLTTAEEVFAVEELGHVVHSERGVQLCYSATHPIPRSSWKCTAPRPCLAFHVRQRRDATEPARKLCHHTHPDIPPDTGMLPGRRLELDHGGVDPAPHRLELLQDVNLVALGVDFDY